MLNGLQNFLKTFLKQLLPYVFTVILAEHFGFRKIEKHNLKKCLKLEGQYTVFFFFFFFLFFSGICDFNVSPSLYQSVVVPFLTHIEILYNQNLLYYFVYFF